MPGDLEGLEDLGSLEGLVASEARRAWRSRQPGPSIVPGVLIIKMFQNVMLVSFSFDNSLIFN